eukprot:11611085-Alexandrium_andersonii.AAC.1
MRCVLPLCASGIRRRRCEDIACCHSERQGSAGIDARSVGKTRPGVLAAPCCLHHRASVLAPVPPC